MLQGRAYRPQLENILVGNNPYMTKEVDYDLDVYEDTKKLLLDGDPYYIIGNKLIEEPNDTHIRLFNSLKRHAMMSLNLRKPKFLEGGTTKKIPYKSILGYTQDRGGGTLYVHRVYPENDSYYIDMQYNEEGLHPNRAKRFVYNPTGTKFNYDSYDYSNTVPARQYDYHYNPKTKNIELGEGDFVFFNENDGNYDPSVTAYLVILRLQNQNMPLVEPELYANRPRGYRGGIIYR